MRKLLPLCSIILALGLSSPSYAGDYQGFYLGVNTGWSITTDSDFSDTGASGDVEHDGAINFGAAAGYRFSPMFRGELEVSYRKTDLDSLTLSGVGTSSAGGDLATTLFLLNGYVDFDLNSIVTPYLSAGIGMANHKGDVKDIPSLGVTAFSDTDRVFAYQAGLGLGVEVADRTSLTTGYRYVGSSEYEIDSVDFDYGNYEFRVGLMFSF